MSNSTFWNFEERRRFSSLNKSYWAEVFCGSIASPSECIPQISNSKPISFIYWQLQSVSQPIHFHKGAKRCERHMKYSRNEIALELKLNMKISAAI